MQGVLVNCLALLIVMTISKNRFVLGSGYPTSDQPSKGPDNSESSGANYKFEYGVDDGASGSQFGHEEERNGQQTRGQYRVLLPDGRLQVVTYTADENGYKADVTYENGPAAKEVSGGNASGAKETDYENVETSASSYGPPAAAIRSNAEKKTSDGDDNTFGQRTSGRSFVKLRRTIGSRMFNYSY